jgi:hypothetical protein
MNAWFASRVILFQDTGISKCYPNILQTTTSYTSIFQSVGILDMGYCSSHYRYVPFYYEVLCLELKCWLLLYALYYTFILCIAIKVDAVKIQVLNQPLICGDFDFEL